MTSAPVKDVGSLLNFVGNRNLTATGGTNQMGSFGDVMSKAQSGPGQTAGQNKAVTDRETAGSPVSETAGRQDKIKEVKPDTGEKKPVSADTVKEQEEAVEKAGQELVEKISEEMGVSTEDVEKAMEELGLSIYSLFDPNNLSQLVLQLSGEQDAAVLLTDETLFASFQELLQTAGELKQGLAKELNVNPEELAAMMQKLQEEQTQLPEDTTQQGSLVNQVNDLGDKQAQEAPRITIEVETGAETVKMEADENGNPIKVQETVSQEPEKVTEEPQDGGQQQKHDGKGSEQSNSEFHTGNQLLDALLQNKGQTQEATFEQTAAYFRPDTQEIMDQIMDYMKIQLKPGMDQLEMQLHPASLGNVHIQLSSKGGEVTAQFQVQNEEVKAVLESQIMELKESLKDQGVKVEAVQVTVENHGFESNLWQGQGGEQDASSQDNRKTPRRINLNELDELFEEEASEEEQLAVRMMEANGNTVDYTA